MIIAIDGPAGAGKSTVAKLLARKLGILYIDTGAMYRALTLKAIRGGIDCADEESLVRLAASTSIELRDGDNPRVILDGEDVSLEIRQPGINARVSDVAKVKGVREVMKHLQRRIGAVSDSCMDGRDIGTEIFPGAEVKFFIDASFDERVNRRLKDLHALGVAGATKESVARDLENRDRIDSTRKCAPLKKADDAVHIDTTGMPIEEVVSAMLNVVNTRKSALKRKA